MRRPSSGSRLQYLYLDLTQPVVNGLNSSRTGGTIYAARNSGTSAVAVTGADVFESRNDGAGHWSFDTYANTVANPFDFVTGWQTAGSPTVTASHSTGPDGVANSASQIWDNQAAASSIIRYVGVTGTHDSTASVWVKDSSPVPTATGLVAAKSDATRPYITAPAWGRDFTNVFGGSGWRRVTNVTTFASTNIDPEILIQPAGAVNVLGGYATQTASATGAIEAWGAQTINGAVDLPLVYGTTSALVQQIDSSLMPSVLMPNGDLDVEVAFLANYYLPGTTNDQNGTIFSIATPLGTFHLDVAYTTYNWRLGSTLLVTALSPGPNGGWPTLGGQEIVVRTWYKPSTGKAGIQITLGGAKEAYNESGLATSTIGTPTSFYIGSNLGAAGTFYQRRYTAVRRSDYDARGLNDAEGVIIGDSTASSYSTNVMTVGENVYTLAESRSRMGIASLAVTGNTCAQQLTKWQASAQRGNSNTKWVFVMIGVNDVLANSTAATIATGIQNIVTDINTNNPTAKILLAPMIPITMFTTAQKAVWNAVNADIENTGVNNITGSNLIRMPLWSTLNDGSDNLVAAYAYGDNEHENDNGRQYIGGVIRSTLQANGLL